MTSGLWTACLIAVAGIAVCPNAGSQETKPASETKRVWMLSLGQTRDAVVSLMGAPTNQQTADNAEALTWERKVDNVLPYAALLVDGRVSEFGIGRYRLVDRSARRVFEFVPANGIF